MTADVPKVLLNNGTLMPVIGLGTWGSDWGVTFGVSRKYNIEFHKTTDF